MARITIISGFLGAGKTTFANLLLDYYIRTGEKTAYIVNEFGQEGLDSALLKQKGFQTLDIVGGCICCTLRGKITDALREVMTEYNPTRIVFEPSGVFIFEKFLDVLEDDQLKGKCTIDNVITIVDSIHIKDAMFVPGNFFTNQIAHADTLILSKTQLYEGSLNTLTNRLRALNERADIMTKPWSELKDKDFATLDREYSEGICSCGDECCHGYHGHDHHDHHHHDGHEHGHHHHGDEHEHEHHTHLDSVGIRPGDLDEDRLRELETQLKKETFGEVYRIKGKIIYNGEPKLLQAVFDTLRLEENPPAGEPGLTFIGKGLDEPCIREYWT